MEQIKGIKENYGGELMAKQGLGYKKSNKQTQQKFKSLGRSKGGKSWT